MTALSADRLTDKAGQGPVPDILNFPVAASTKIYAGALVAINASGYAVPAASSVALVPIGRAEAQVDNSSGAAGALTVEVRQGMFFFENSAGGNAIANSNFGQPAFVIDDQTVALTSSAGTRAIAGTILYVDSTTGQVAVLVAPPMVAQAALGQANYVKVAADGAAGTATSETAFHRMTRPGKVLAVFFTPSAALTADNTNYATFDVKQRDGAGGGALAIASQPTTVAGGSLTAFVHKSLDTTALTNTTLAAGAVLTFGIAKTGTGVVVPADVLTVVIGPA